jgi:hypothetical protein
MFAQLYGCKIYCWPLGLDVWLEKVRDSAFTGRRGDVAQHWRSTKLCGCMVKPSCLFIVQGVLAVQGLVETFKRTHIDAWQILSKTH